MSPGQEKPILVIQPRRLGDLILTFPLLLRLLAQNPKRPLWVAGQPVFYEPLLPFSPNAAYLPIAHLPNLIKNDFEAVINLGNDRQSAFFTAKSSAETKFGPLLIDNSLFINGAWQLYREGLTQNNRHNPFHWADLFTLDSDLPKIAYPLPRSCGTRRIGLFIGASENAKQPRSLFWKKIANLLADRGFRPILLGGKAEAKTGLEIVAKGARAINFSGKTDLAQLAALLKTLDLLITPDTGPMHLANWLSVPVLNLSMGNVSAAETGPLSPGQHILRAAMSCVGCWQCRRGRLACHEAFVPQSVAEIAQSIAEGNAPLPQAGLELLQAERDDLGLFRLKGQQPIRTILEDFWQAAFLHFNSNAPLERLLDKAEALRGHSPELADKMRATFVKMLAYLNLCRRTRELPPDFWKNQPWHSRIFAGNLQMSLQNSSYSRKTLIIELEKIDTLQSALASA